MKKLKSVFILLLVLLIIAFSAVLCYVGLGENKHFGVANINLGLDLAGGVSITYQAVEGSSPSSAEMEGALAVIQKRLDAKGYTEATAYLDGSDRIRVEIPGVEDANEAVTEIGKTAMLTFVGIDWNQITASSILEEFYPQYVEDAKVKLEEQGQADAYTDEQLLADAKTFFSQYPIDAISMYPSLLDKAKEAGYAEEILTGTNVANATYQKGQTSQNGSVEPYVRLDFDETGKALFAAGSEKYLNKYIAIMLDTTVCSMPSVNSVINDGQALITGMATDEAAKNLAADIVGGALPVQLEDIEHNSVGASLGQDALNTSLLAAIIGFAIIIVFMIVFYRVPGLASAFALVFYITMELLLINVLDMTLTLPGVAGIILSIGMAVDANIIIFSRIREEITMGRTLRVSVRDGFKKALSAILDGNITTLIASLVLYFFGSGTIRGFAQTLALGIIISMVTSLVVTRLILSQFMVLLPQKNQLYCIAKKKKAVQEVAK
ncbi:MAG: protein translocase subunit SecD [Lachnospiraceae bacterium]|jgi:protein-export membrane protein SecD|nr:protein translocase subunit SecD [Lachnospiraceae bacterium]